MRKVLIIGFVALLSVVLTYGFADAKVSGACYKCHTMHNSQGGTDVYSGGAQVHLLNNTCLGCHTTTGNDPIVNGYPYVQVGTGSDTNSLAGGFFTSADPANSGKSHSLDLAGANPPGYDASYRDTAYVNTNGLKCAGTSGCHGDSSKADPGAAISGGHHGTSIMGYRMLVAKNSTKVRGTGASDYEKLLISSSGSDTTKGRNHYSAGTAGDSISEFCATCHGKFHGDIGSSSEGWTRHPTDVAIPTSWEIYTDFATKWNGSASVKDPLGFTGDTETNGTAQVICLSCHRAHGTAHNDLLRWDYDLMSAGSTTVNYGCLGCHNKQRG